MYMWVGRWVRVGGSVSGCVADVCACVGVRVRVWMLCGVDVCF